MSACSIRSATGCCRSATVGALLWIVLKILLIAMPVIITVAFYVVWERKLIGWMHVRHGPMYVGMGILQAFADVFKLLFKEVIQPDQGASRSCSSSRRCSRWRRRSRRGRWCRSTTRLVLSNANAGLLYLLAMTSLGVYGIILAGWASNSKYAFLGAMRAAAQVVSLRDRDGLRDGRRADRAPAASTSPTS